MKNDANRRLATALGWTNIVEVAGALLGTPPKGEPECRNQAAVPDWAGDWRECGPLMAEYECWPEMHQGVIRVGQYRETGWWEWKILHRAVGVVPPGASIDVVMRELIVQAVAAKLEAGQ